jgi:hypothetical protein
MGKIEGHSPTALVAADGIPGSLIDACVAHHAAMGFRQMILISGEDHPESTSGKPEATLNLVRIHDPALGRDKTREGYLASINTIASRWLTTAWCLVIHGNEFLIYPKWPKQSIYDLIDFMTNERRRNLYCLIVDCYRRPGPRAETGFAQQPLFGLHDLCFDQQGYVQSVSDDKHVIVRGGPYLRSKYSARPEALPVINRNCMFKWRRRLSLERIRIRGQEGWIESTVPFTSMSRVHSPHHLSVTACLLRIGGAVGDPLPDDLFNDNSRAFIGSDQLEREGFMTRGQWL